jgi:hypothetical protein
MNPVDSTINDGMKNLARLLRARTMLAAHEGQMDKAALSISQSFKLAQAFDNQPLLINQLIRLAYYEMSVKTLLDTLKFGDLSEAQAKALYDQLSKIDLDPSYESGLITERAAGITFFPQAVQTVLPGWLYYKYEIRYLDIMDKELKKAELGYREAAQKGYMNSDNDGDRQPSIFPAFSRALATRDTTKANLLGSQIVLALQAYKSRYGVYPSSLEECKVKLGWKIPLDLFSEKPFHYKRHENGFLLYSIGANMKDDGAVEIDRWNDLMMADLVYRVNR